MCVLLIVCYTCCIKQCKIILCLSMSVFALNGCDLALSAEREGGGCRWRGGGGEGGGSRGRYPI